MKQKRVAILIDGGNLYHKFKNKELGIKNTTKFDYYNFCKFLARDRKIISLTYYVEKVKVKKNNPKGEIMRKSQQKLFSHLENSGFDIKTGYLMKNNDKYHEKGVDVQLAIDLLVGAYENLYETAILVSSDTDLIPAIKKVKELNKEVEYIGFSHCPSFGLLKNVKKSKLLSKEDVENFSIKSLL